MKLTAIAAATILAFTGTSAAIAAGDTHSRSSGMHQGSHSSSMHGSSASGSAQMQNDPEIIRVIEQDLADGRVLDVRKTPGIFVNGKPLEPFSAEAFRNLMESELRANYPDLAR